MGTKATISRDMIVDAAFARAKQDGLASLSVRAIAQDCSVAVGSIYNHFPDKAALVTEVIARFWTSAVRQADERACFSYQAGENFVDFCRRAAGGLHEALVEFRADWLREVSALDARTRQRGKAAEQACFERVRTSLVRVIEADAAIDPAMLERVAPEALADFTWTGMLESLKAGDPSCATLFAVLERALYPANVLPWTGRENPHVDERGASC